MAANDTLATLAAMLGGGFTGYSETLKRRQSEAMDRARMDAATQELGLTRDRNAIEREAIAAAAAREQQRQAFESEQNRLDREAAEAQARQNAALQRELAGANVRAEAAEERKQQEALGRAYMEHYGSHPEFSRIVQQYEANNPGISRGLAAFYAGQVLLPPFRSIEEYENYMRRQGERGGGAPAAPMAGGSGAPAGPSLDQTVRRMYTHGTNESPGQRTALGTALFGPEVDDPLTLKIRRHMTIRAARPELSDEQIARMVRDEWERDNPKPAPAPRGNAAWK